MISIVLLLRLKRNSCFPMFNVSVWDLRYSNIPYSFFLFFKRVMPKEPVRALLVFVRQFCLCIPYYINSIVNIPVVIVQERQPFLTVLCSCLNLITILKIIDLNISIEFFLFIIVVPNGQNHIFHSVAWQVFLCIPYNLNSIVLILMF